MKAPQIHHPGCLLRSYSTLRYVFLVGKVVQKLHVWRLFLTTPLAACHLAFWTDGCCCSQNLQFLTTSNLQPFAGGPQPSGIQLFVSKQMSFRLKALRTHLNLNNDFLEIREGTPKKLIENSLGRNMMEHDRTIVINISKLLFFRQAWQMTPTWVSVTSIIVWVISSSKQSCCPRNSWPNFSMASHTDRGSLLAVLSTYCNNLISCAMVRWQLADPSSLFLNMAIFWELIILSEIRPCQG